MKLFIKNTMLILMIATITFTACKKGDTGAIGPQGEQGKQGIKGDDGNTILSGKGVPSASVGDIGDFYIDLNADALYGPKTSSGWGSSSNLKGATGATGKIGSTILSGNGAPASALGAVGDYYFDKTNSLFYGPKTSSSWGGGLSLKGKDGNANVKSRTFTNTQISWSDFSEYGTNYKKTMLSVPKITDDIAANGIVAVYGGLNFEGTDWTAFPVTYYDGSKICMLKYGFAKGLVSLYFSYSNNSVPPAPDIKFRVVVAQGTAVTNNINFKDYDAVKKAFHLNN